MIRESEYAVYEKKAAHGPTDNSVIMGPYKTFDEAEAAGKRYGYHGDNYYVDEFHYNHK